MLQSLGISMAVSLFFPQVGAPETAGGVTEAPVPLSATLRGEFAALLVTFTLPVKEPLPDGANVTLSEAVFPAATTCPAETPVALKPAPETETLDTVTSEFPLFVNVTD